MPHPVYTQVTSFDGVFLLVLSTVLFLIVVNLSVCLYVCLSVYFVLLLLFFFFFK